MIYSLKDKQVALLVIDVQREYFDEKGPAYVPDANATLPNVNSLIDSFRAASQPVLFIRHANRADGSDLGRMGDFSDPDEVDAFVEGTPRVEFEPSLHLGEGGVVITKRRYSSFTGTELLPVLHTLKVQSVVIAGLMTSYCCESTARDAFNLDFEVLFVKDAVAGPDLEDTNGNNVPSAAVLASTCTALASGFAEVVPTEEVLSRLKG